MVVERESERRHSLTLQHISVRYNMAAASITTTLSNDGGIILTLFLMASTISYFIFTAVGIYEGQQPSPTKASWLCKVSGIANLGNALTHILLIIYTISQTTRIIQNTGLKNVNWY